MVAVASFFALVVVCAAIAIVIGNCVDAYAARHVHKWGKWEDIARAAKTRELLQERECETCGLKQQCGVSS